MPKRDKEGFYGGLLLVFFGGAAMFVARGYRIGTTFRMGPGYFPLVLSSLLMVIGIIVAVTSFRSAPVELKRFAWRPLILVSIAVGLFGVTVNSAGIVLSTFVTVLLSRFTRPGYPWLETVALSIGITLLCAVVFYYGLNVQIPLLPLWWG